MDIALHIGPYGYGSTSRMRANKMYKILLEKGIKLEIIDTEVPILKYNRLWNHVAWHYKRGPVISAVNKYVKEQVGERHFKLIWVDKAIYLTRQTTDFLRSQTDLLVHYTPDPSFTFHRSRLFFESLPLYDYVITTKTYEMEDYIRIIGDSSKLLYLTQGFDKDLHRPMVPWDQKKGVAFIGHYEKEREEPLLAMLEAGIDINLAGACWEKFAQMNAGPHLHFLGRGVFGEDYVSAISGSKYAWGAVSKWIPEKHTTRTFEIPACMTALLTERNDELESLFNEEEVVFYDSIDELVKKIRFFDSHDYELKTLTERGYEKVQSGGFDYESQLRRLLELFINKGYDTE